MKNIETKTVAIKIMSTREFLLSGRSGGLITSLSAFAQPFSTIGFVNEISMGTARTNWVATSAENKTIQLSHKVDRAMSPSKKSWARGLRWRPTPTRLQIFKPGRTSKPSSRWRTSRARLAELVTSLSTVVWFRTWRDYRRSPMCAVAPGVGCL